MRKFKILFLVCLVSGITIILAACIRQIVLKEVSNADETKTVRIIWVAGSATTNNTFFVELLGDNWFEESQIIYQGESVECDVEWIDNDELKIIINCRSRSAVYEPTKLSDCDGIKIIYEYVNREWMYDEDELLDSFE